MNAPRADRSAARSPAVARRTPHTDPPTRSAYPEIRGSAAPRAHFGGPARWRPGRRQPASTAGGGLALARLIKILVVAGGFTTTALTCRRPPQRLHTNTS